MKDYAKPVMEFINLPVIDTLIESNIEGED